MPTNPRIFVTHIRQKALSSDVNIKVEFRWSLPEHPNGEIESFEVFVSDNSMSLGAWRSILREPDDFKYSQPANENQVFYFKVNVANEQHFVTEGFRSKYARLSHLKDCPHSRPFS